jgi:diaminopimelate decarboxylase
MDESTRRLLDELGREFGTPCFIYLTDEIDRRIEALERAFRARFLISYAVKANPNVGLLRSLRSRIRAVDVSASAELDRILAAGFDAHQASFSGPGKRRFELERAVRLGCGEVVCESRQEIEALNEIAGAFGRTVPYLVRINPARMPRRFGVNMAGKPSQFGIDEEQVDAVLARRERWTHLDLRGFHIYSGTNSLDEAAIAENFGIFIELFDRLATTHSLIPRRLIFGSGFGIPYLPGDRELSLETLAALINPLLDSLRAHPRLGQAEYVLEMGRWLVGPPGYLITSVIAGKSSRGAEIRICDAGFNNLLAAFGMMGSVIRRNWRIWNLDPSADRPMGKYHLVGPLCTTIDVLATDIELPEVEVGQRLAIGAAGAYGLTASPTRFISHPEPREILVRHVDGSREVEEVTESRLNWPTGDFPVLERGASRAAR